MTLRIRPQREPFARTRKTTKAEVVRGVAYWRLYASLEKYCRGRTLGRSWLISGNRGVGKTTLVRAAIEDLRLRSQLELKEREPANGEDAFALVEEPLRRPLFVPLSGPDIMRERVRPRPAADSGNAGNPTTTAQASQDNPALVSRVEESDNLLRQIARALHVAIAKEFAHSYENTLRGAPSPDVLEAGAQLRIELGQGIKVQALRRFWDLSGRFAKGILFSPRAPSTDPVHEHIRSDRQGLYELVALDVSTEAYQIAIGKVQRELEQMLEEKSQSDDGHTVEQIKASVAPIVSVIGGVATGFGVFNASGGGTAALFEAFGAALLAILVLALGLTPKRTSTAQDKLTFSPDTAVGSLTWRLGAVVDALFQAGLAPVFVIDELDKVTLERDLSTWIGDRAQELKALLTEQAFFCFLTGRSFAEKMYSDRVERTYPPSYTQFSNYLFVNHLPLELHQYLTRLVEHQHDVDPAANQHEELQAAIFPFVVLFRAEMHPVDIQRELNALVTQHDNISLFPAGQALPRVDSFALLFQIAVESVLANKDVERRMRDDARFALLVVDAVYYAPRMWRGGRELNISAIAIQRYLNARRAPDEPRRNGKNPTIDASPAHENEVAQTPRADVPAGPSASVAPANSQVSERPTTSDRPPATHGLPELPTSDQKLLEKCVHDVVGVIRNLSEFLRLLDEEWFLKRIRSGVGSDVERTKSLIIDVLPKSSDQLLEPIDASNTLFRWCYDVHGLAVASDANLQRIQASVAGFRQLEREVDNPLRALPELACGLELLETRYALLQHSLKWPEARRLASRLEVASGVGDAAAELVTEALDLETYVAVVTAALPVITAAAGLAKILAPDKQLKDSLRSVADALELHRLPNEKRGPRVIAGLSALAERIRPGLHFNELTHAPGFATDLAATITQARELATPPIDALDPYFSDWLVRLQERLRGFTTVREPGWPDVALLLAREGRPSHVSKAFLDNTASLWTQIALSAASMTPASDGLTYPPFYAPYALALLGAYELALLSPQTPELVPLLPILHERADTRRLICIVAAEPSELGVLSWQVNPRHAALVVSRQQLQSLTTYFTIPVTTLSAREAWLIVEGSESEGIAAAEMAMDSKAPESWRAMFPPSRRMPMLAREPKRAVLSGLRSAARPPCVVGARTIEEAVALADHEALARAPQAS